MGVRAVSCIFNGRRLTEFPLISVLPAGRRHTPNGVSDIVCNQESARFLYRDAHRPTAGLVVAVDETACAMPSGLPSLNGTKTTLYPFSRRFRVGFPVEPAATAEIVDDDIHMRQSTGSSRIAAYSTPQT